MFRRPRGWVCAAFIAVTLALAGCTLETSSSAAAQAPLTKVEIHFSGANDVLTGYLRGLTPDRVYTGGLTTTPLYDDKGNVVAVINLNRVTYIKVLDQGQK